MDTDAERIERLRELWAKWRFHIISGLAMALAAVGGFSWENLNRQAERRAANEALFRVLIAAREERPEEAESAFADLRSESYPDLRHLGAFAIADQRLQGEQHESAEAALREVMENSEDDGLRDLAALRLGEALTGRGAFAEAEQLLSQRVPNQGAARILFQDRIGDAAALRGDTQAALAAYRQAENQAQRDFPNYIPLLEFKIGALLAGITAAEADSSGGETETETEAETETTETTETETETETETAADDSSAGESDSEAESDSESPNNPDGDSDSGESIKQEDSQ